MTEKVEKIKGSFRLGENEGNPAEFTYQGRSCVFYNGTEITVTPELADWINSRRYPLFEFDKETGQSKFVGWKHRFFFIPLDMRKVAEEQAKAEQQARAK